MVGSSILPVSIHNGKLYFLFGKENELEKSAQGFSDFGGGMEKGETAFDTACREGAEELTGFLGSSNNIRKFIRNGGGYLKLGDPTKYNIHIIRMDYDEKLIEYYNNNHQFLWKKMDKSILSNTKLFEKIEIQWFSLDDIKKNIHKFRPFYQKILKMEIITPIQILQIHKWIKYKKRGQTLRHKDFCKSKCNFHTKNKRKINTTYKRKN